MRALVKVADRRRINRALDANHMAIVQSLANTPDDFTGREPLWIERLELLKQKETL